MQLQTQRERRICLCTVCLRRLEFGAPRERERVNVLGSVEEHRPSKLGVMGWSLAGDELLHFLLAKKEGIFFFFTFKTKDVFKENNVSYGEIYLF